MSISETVNTAVAYGESHQAWSSGRGVVVFPKGTPVPDTNAKLQETVVAEWATTDDGVVVRSSTFDEESYGEDLDQAKLDLLTSMVDHLEALESRESTLSPHDAAVLTNLRDAVTTD